MEGRSYGTSIDVRNVGHLRAARRYGAAIIYPQQYHRPFPLPLPSSRLVRAERSREGRGAQSRWLYPWNVIHSRGAFARRRLIRTRRFIRMRSVVREKPRRIPSVRHARINRASVASKWGASLNYLKTTPFSIEWERDKGARNMIDGRRGSF